MKFLIQTALVSLRMHLAVPRTWHYIVLCLWGLVGASKLGIRLGMLDSPDAYPFWPIVLVNAWFQRIPISVFEICSIVLFVFICLWIARSINIILDKKVRRDKFASVLRKFLDIFFLLVAVDTWGGLATGVSVVHVRDQLDWHDRNTTITNSDQITRLCQQLVKEANKFRSADIKSIDSFPNETPRINNAIEIGFRHATTALDLPSQWKAKSTIPKPLITSKIWNSIGVLGYYSPYTAEIVYDKNMSPVWFPYVLAHEKAHSMGILYEDEAMLMGYLACVYSGEPNAQYSAICHALVIFVRHLNRLDPPQAEKIWQRVALEVRLDIIGRFPAESHLNTETLRFIDNAWHQLIVFSGDERGLESYDDVTLLCDFAASRNGLIFSESWSQGYSE